MIMTEKKGGENAGLRKYTTDGKVTHLTTEEDINTKLASLLGPKFSEYRRRWDAANRFELEMEFPLFLHIEIHQKCNLRCPYCTQGIPELRQKYINSQRMSWETYTRLILEGEEHGCPSTSPQGIEEPLLTPDLEKYIKFAHDHGYLDIMINTNGTLLTQGRARKLLDSGLTRLRLSLDGYTKETFEKCRLGACYDEVMRNFDTFLALRIKGGYKLPLVGVSFVKTKWNEHEVDAFINHWRGRVDIVTIQEFIPPDTEGDYSEFYASNSHLRDSMSEEFQCVQPWQRVVVRNTGLVCPCCAMFSADLPMGHFPQRSIYAIWNSPQMKELRQLHKEGRYRENEVCLRCVDSILCKVKEPKPRSQFKEWKAKQPMAR